MKTKQAIIDEAVKENRESHGVCERCRNCLDCPVIDLESDFIRTLVHTAFEAGRQAEREERAQIES